MKSNFFFFSLLFTFAAHAQTWSSDELTLTFPQSFKATDLIYVYDASGQLLSKKNIKF